MKKLKRKGGKTQRARTKKNGSSLLLTLTELLGVRGSSVRCQNRSREAPFPQSRRDQSGAGAGGSGGRAVDFKGPAPPPPPRARAK